ncbi:hypothetical protein JZ751_009003 [Albula glossodonta]|uniref:Uncharacterized protein n=1 Tax=Albula glossodonta TaxID=121402 RepID=A0A8T2PAX1_9TELE|nr:hypothetical protein JZ751_009003 [Albula glossodonta]
MQLVGIAKSLVVIAPPTFIGVCVSDSPQGEAVVRLSAGLRWCRLSAGRDVLSNNALKTPDCAVTQRSSAISPSCRFPRTKARKERMRASRMPMMARMFRPRGKSPHFG